MNPTSNPAATSGPRAALEQLAAALDPGHCTAELVTGYGPHPYLLVASRHAPLSEAIYANGEYYYWPWGQPVAAIGNPNAAASKAATVLAATPEPAHG